MDGLWRTLWSVVGRHAPTEVSSFLVVGGLGYVTDVAVFNIALSTSPFDHWDPSAARVVAVAVAMVVTYCGNRWLTWRGETGQARPREVALFVVFNVIGLGISTVTLVISHDILGLTSRLDDNLSANVVGLALGTLFRFWSYRRYVFAPVRPPVPDPTPVPVGSGPAAPRPLR